jgi:hypothetical protein
MMLIMSCSCPVMCLINCLHSSTVATAVMQCVFHVIFRNAAVFLGYAS